MGTIKLKNVVKSFGTTQVLKEVDLTIEDGSFTILLGPSGCGKSTLLRIISGLEGPTSGHVYMNDREITTAEPKDREVAMVFQNYALYPHMSVYKNVEYGLKIKKVPKAQRKEIVEAALAQVELADQAQKLPSQMSGGQRQRVALARAIVKRPAAFLMDEPLSNLDAKLRSAMRVELTRMYRELETTFLYVTHDQVEAMSMGTYIVIMNKGVIMQQGTPQEIYENPANQFVAGFIGSPPTNLVPVENGHVGIRPEHLSFQSQPVEGQISLPCAITSTEQLGAESIIHGETSLGMLTLRCNGCWGRLDQSGFACFHEQDILFFDAQGERADNTPGIKCLREFSASGTAKNGMQVAYG
ncbi:MAG: ABC transporter ATP-binding protein [Oscillospiraceae bacterium]|nr:ABC transporter ATP-binding protein [Oscillospiraceae bacterium]